VELLRCYKKTCK